MQKILLSFAIPTAVALAYLISSALLFSPDLLTANPSVMVAVRVLGALMALGALAFSVKRTGLRKAVGFAVKTYLVVAAYLLVFRPESFGLDPRFFGGVKPIDMWRQITEASTYSMRLLIFWLALASGVKILGIFSGVIRWKLLLKGQGIKMPFWYMSYLWFAGRAIGMFVPGTLGLDGWRLVESARYTREFVKCTTVIVIEKLTGFIALTFLVFITFPFGFKLLDINPILFGVILAALFCFTAGCFLLLFNPRIIQVLVTVLPCPGKLRNVVNRIGAAATAYSDHRGMLVLAVFFGLGVHLAICVMTFCTMMAIRAPDTSLYDIMFAAPIMIYASVITPTINGMGVRELIFGQLLGAKSGYDAAVTYGHLGLWTGEFVPFLLSIPLLLIGGRPSKEKLEHDLAELRAQSRVEDDSLHLSQEEVTGYRNKVFGTLLCGAFGGLIAGALIGLGEASWILSKLGGLTDMGMFTWGPTVYGLLFACVGLGVSGGLLFFYLLFDRFAKGRYTLALSFGGAMATGGLIIGFFRFKRDVLGEMNPSQDQLIKLGLMVGVLALVGMVILFVASRFVAGRLGDRRALFLGSGVGAYALIIALGALAGLVAKPAPASANFAPTATATGPNIILVAVDTLRADYLSLYNPDTPTKTPNLEAFRQDAVLFEQSFSQASWTKASFGTIFSGMYPECHTAVTKTASLPPDVETVAELLSAGGYYTQGFSNNPNIMSTFGYGQGHVEYVDLKPSLPLYATESSSRMSMFEVLKRVRLMVRKKLRLKMQVTEFYQPAPEVTRRALEWVDSGAVPEGVPSYLFVHYMDPHDPFMDPKAPMGGYGRAAMGDPDPEQWLDAMINAYIGEIELLDEHLGLFFEGLKQRGLYDETLIILTADHGEEFQEHGGWWHGQTLYDEQTHIPMLIKLPGKAHAGETNKQFARNIDLAPTMLHFAGFEKGSLMQGDSLFADGGFANADAGYTYAENNFEGIVLQAIRTYDKKLIEANEGNKRNLAPVEFYDLSTDPGEQENLAGDAALAETQTQLEGAIDQYLQICEENAVEPAATGEISEELQQQLEGLGYLE